MRLTVCLCLLFALGACTYTAKITDGRTAVERKQYDVAVPMLQREYKRAKTRSEKGKIAFALGSALRETGKDADAVEWFQRAYDGSFGPEALEEKAAAQKRLEQYEEAIETYTNLGFEIGSKYEYRNDIAGAESAIEWRTEEAKGKKNAYAVSVTGFNSTESDYAATPFGDQLVITSDRRAATGEEEFKWTGRGFTDLFVVEPEGSSATPFGPGINTPDHEGTPAFSPDGKKMYFVRCTAPGKREDAYCGLYEAERSGGGWSNPWPLEFVRPGYNYLHPTLSADGKKLYFSAQLEEGWGGYDLYVSLMTAEGDWDEPTLLNRSINSEGNEQFPTFDADTLYFASDGRGGMGGLDIYRTHLMENGRWSAPKNLRTPINSGADDFHYVVTERTGRGVGSTVSGYFSSSRPGGVGADDVYRFDYVQLPPPPEPEIPPNYKNVLDVYVVEKVYAEPGNPDSRVLGKKPIPNATIIASIGDQSRTVTTNDEGKLSLVLVDNQQYDFRAEREEYLADEGRFSSRNLPRDPEAPEQRYELELELEKIYRNREIVLENIYYDLDESFIREDAQPTLNELTTLLERNPDIRIELSSHTDCRGRDAYNQQLSQARAEAAVNYLTGKGIAADRLTARGYGEEQPVAECICERCSEEEHQRNRRTSFRILE